MSTTLIFSLGILSAITAIGSVIGGVFLAVAMLKSSKKYQADILELRERGKYQEWLERNKGQVIFNRISLTFVILFLLALLVNFGQEFVRIPSPILMISHVLTFAFYPCAFIGILISAWLYRKALKDLRKQIDVP